MTQSYPKFGIDTNNPDPTIAVAAFLWCMNKARELGLSPPTEHVLAEHLFRRDAKIVFYSSMSGVLSLVMDEKTLDDFNDEDTMEMIFGVLKRRRDRARAKREAAARDSDGSGEAGETEGLDPKGDSAGRDSGIAQGEVA